MKKNLQLALAITLGLATTVSAQDWSVDSRTRTDMGGDNDKFETEQRFRVGTSFGGDDWGVHVSTDVNFQLGDASQFSEGGVNATIHEAYATANVMGYADLTIGRQALEFGSGNIIGANNWGSRAVTRDAASFDFDNDMADLSVFLGKTNDGLDNDFSFYGVNASKDMGGVAFNVMYVSQDDNGAQTSAMGVDAGYSVMGVDLSMSYNSMDFEGADDNNYMVLGASYSVSDDLTIRAARTTYGDGGFILEGTNTGQAGASWMSHGNMGYLGAGDQDLAFGGDYNMGDFTVGATMHTVTNEANAAFERNVTEFNVGYTMGDNTSFGVKYADDADVKYMWATLSVGF